MPLTYFNTKFNTNKNQTRLGRTTDIYAIPGGYRPTTNSYVPAHGISLGGSVPTAQEQPGRMTGGAGGGSPTAASITVKAVGSTFLAGTINELKFVMTVDSRIEEIVVQYDSAASETAAGIAAGLKAALDDVHGNTAFAAGSRVISSNPNNSRAQIAAAFVATFGATASAAFAVATDTLTITYGATGTDGNFFEVTSAVRNSLPSPLPTIIPGVGSPDLPGLVHLGGIVDLKYTVTPETVEIKIDNSRFPLGTITTGSKAEGSFTIVQNANSRYIELVSGSIARGASDTADILFPGGVETPLIVGLIAVSTSAISGQKDYTLFYEVTMTGGAEVNRSRTANPALPVKFVPVPSTSPGDPIGVEYSVRNL